MIITIMILITLIFLVMGIIGLYINDEGVSILGFIIFTFCLVFSPAIIDTVEYNPIRSEDALQQCMSRGFDYAESYMGFLRTKAYGVKCGYSTIERKDVEIKSQNSERVVLIS
jgi:hypothetical protein